MKKYVIYYRVSTKSQGDSGLGLEAQKRDINIYFDSYEKDSHEVIGTFTDIASGGKDDREEYLNAISLVKETGATLLVAKLDRISRKVSTIACLMEEIDFKVAVMPQADRFQLHLYAALAEMERDFIKKRTKAALAVIKEKSPEKLSKGVGSKWRTSYTANRHNHKTTRNSEETAKKNQPAVEMIRDMVDFSSDSLTLDEIASKLNAKGMTTSRGNPFHAMAVSRLIKKNQIAYKKKTNL